MKCQSLFSGNNNINLSLAELAQSVVKVKLTLVMLNKLTCHAYL